MEIIHADAVDDAVDKINNDALTSQLSLFIWRYGEWIPTLQEEFKKRRLQLIFAIIFVWKIWITSGITLPF